MFCQDSLWPIGHRTHCLQMFLCAAACSDSDLLLVHWTRSSEMNMNTNANRTDIFLIPKPGPRARRGIRDSHRMSFYDARFHHTFQCLSLNVKDQNWEWDLAEHEVWLPNWRRHQAKAGAVRALGRGSRLRIPRRRASPMLKEQAEVIKCAVQKKEASKFCAWQNREVSLP